MMSEELDAIQAAVQRMGKTRDEASSVQSKALLMAMQGVQAALAELISMGEREAEPKPDEDAAERAAQKQAVDAIVAAIRGLKLEAPSVDLTPQFNLPPMSPTINLPEIQPQFQVPAAEVHILPPPPAAPAPEPWKALHVTFDQVNGVIYGATITRE